MLTNLLSICSPPSGVLNGVGKKLVFKCLKLVKKHLCVGGSVVLVGKLDRDVYFPLLSPLSSTKSWMPHVINKGVEILNARFVFTDYLNGSKTTVVLCW
jgi:hypothetical protein